MRIGRALIVNYLLITWVKNFFAFVNFIFFIYITVSFYRGSYFCRVLNALILLKF